MIRKLHIITHLTLLLAATAGAGALQAASLATAGPLRWEFEVFLDDKPIGSHDFTLERDGGALRLQTNASFDVRFLFFTAYTYRHRNTELWDARGLLSIDAFTDANGKIHDIRGSRAGDEFILQGGQQPATLTGRLMTFAYWNPAILAESHLLNSQTGEYEPVQVVDRGACTVEFKGRQIPASRHDLLLSAGASITVWYAADDRRWLALESVTESGRVLRYKPVQLPGAPVALATVEAHPVAAQPLQ